MPLPEEPVSKETGSFSMLSPIPHQSLIHFIKAITIQVNVKVIGDIHIGMTQEARKYLYINAFIDGMRFSRCVTGSLHRLCRFCWYSYRLQTNLAVESRKSPPSAGREAKCVWSDYRPLVSEGFAVGFAVGVVPSDASSSSVALVTP